MSLVSWLNRRFLPLITAVGITPRSVTLEVRGRISVKPIRLSVSPSDLNGKKYLVSLAGERAWVKNVRAAHGEAFIIRGTRRRVELREIPVDERAPILLAYVQRLASMRVTETGSASLLRSRGANGARHAATRAEVPGVCHQRCTSLKTPLWQHNPWLIAAPGYDR
jgi:hypothetical protein